MFYKTMKDKPSYYRLVIISFLSLTVLIFLDISTTKIINLPYVSYQQNTIESWFFISSVCVISIAVVVLFIIKKIGIENSEINRQIQSSSKITFVIYMFILSLLIYLNYTVTVQDKYYFLIPMIITYLSYFFGLVFSGLMMLKFLKWYKEKRDYALFGYLITIGTIFMFILFSISFFSYITLNDFTLVVKPMNIKFLIAERNTFLNIFEGYFNISYIVCMISLAAVTFFALRDYVKINNVIYCVLFSLPLTYLLFKYVPPALNMVVLIIMGNPVFYGMLYTIFLSGTGPLAGFLFFLPMFFFASRLRNQEIKKFLWLTSFGMLLFFTSNQEPPLQNKLFPPFGIMSSAIMGLSVYLIFLGIVSTVMYLSNMTAYRDLISKKLREDKLFRTIARSLFEQKLMPIVNSVVEKNLFPIENRDELSPDELNLYLTEVKRVLLDRNKKRNLQKFDDKN
jgi:hypothetical protein